MDALIKEHVQCRVDELRQEARRWHQARAATQTRRRVSHDHGAQIRIATASAPAHDGREAGRLVARTGTMLQDPFMLKELGSQRLEALRREAAFRSALRPPVGRLRRTAGRSLVRAGLRLLGHTAPAELFEQALS